MFPAAHMALDKFIMRLQTDEDKARQMVLRYTCFFAGSQKHCPYISSTNVFRNEYYQADPVRNRRRPKYMASDKHMLAVAERYDNHYRPTDQLLRYLRCMQFHLCKSRFEADGEDDPLEEVDEHEAGDDNDPDGVPADPEAGGDEIPHNESHPSVNEADIEAALGEDNGEAVPVANADGIRHNEANDPLPVAQRAVREVPAQRALHAEAEPPTQLQASQAAQSQNDATLPGGSQLGPTTSTNAATVIMRRPSKRVAALSASQAWGTLAGTSTSRARLS